MHDFDRFRSDMANTGGTDRPKCYNKYCHMICVPDNGYECDHINNCKIVQMDPNPVVTNLAQFNSQQTIPNCTVITLDGLDGFMWIGPDGVRHNEGLRWPTMRIEQNCTIEVLTDEYGRESKGWCKSNDGL